jgi:group I intron endonuclease
LKFYIYKITCTENNKVYIGQTCNIKRRLYEHRYALKHNKHYCEHLQNCYNKYGKKNFKFEIIEDATETNVDEKERFWIEHYNSNDKMFGFNSESGGNKNKQLSNEHRMKISLKVAGRNNPMYGVCRKGKDAPFYGKNLSDEAKEILSIKAKKRYKTHSKYINSEEAIIKRSISNTGKKRTDEFCNRMSEIAKERTGEKNPFYGKKHTEETKRKISEANKGGTGGGKSNKKILAINIDTGEQILYNSKTEASKNGFPSRMLINKVINGEYKQYNGHIFKEI